MKKTALVFITLLLLHRCFCQDYRVLQADKSKIFVSTTKIDNVLQVVIINADWRLDYINKGAPSHSTPIEFLASSDSTAVPRTKTVPTAEHHSKEKLAHTFYLNIPPGMDVNGIFKRINSEYRDIGRTDGDFKLIHDFLPDSTVEYTVHGYRGNSSAALEVLYLWGAPMRDWSIGFTLSIHDREARKVLSSIICMSPNDTELSARKIRIPQASLLQIMSYAEMFCFAEVKQ
jgi:hypothetical protein